MSTSPAASEAIKKGIVLSPNDFTWDGWLPALREAGLNYVGLHSSLDAITSFLESREGERVLAAADGARIDVNFELHILSDLLPRSLFESDPTFFRVDEEGNRTADANLCVANASALTIVCENTCRHAATLRRFHEIERYYFWPHDNRPWCHCPSCRELSYSEQCLLLMNAMCRALRETQPSAKVAYLAYTTTLAVPSRIAPEDGVFLQYAPIYREYDRALDDPDCEKNWSYVAPLGDLCQFFGTDDAEVLEYWLDVSRFSGWRRPAVRIPFSQEVLERDVSFYAKLGFRRFSTFGVWIDNDYVEQFGVPPLKEYGRVLDRLPET